MIRMTITDTEWTIAEQTAEYQGHGETAERARELADTQEAYLINNARGILPTGWRYEGDGAFTGPALQATNTMDLLTVIGSLQIEACDFATAPEA